MIKVKAFALSLLVVSSLSFGRVQLQTQTEVKSPTRNINQTINITFEIDASESLEIYNRDNVKIVVQLLNENTDNAIARFTIYSMNESGSLEKMSEPLISFNYSEPEIIAIGSGNGDSLYFSILAHKI